MKAARAVLDDYDRDVEKLKAAEPWLFAAHADKADVGDAIAHQVRAQARVDDVLFG